LGSSALRTIERKDEKEIIIHGGKVKKEKYATHETKKND